MCSADTYRADLALIHVARFNGCERTPLKILEPISFTVAGPGRLATHSRRSARLCDLGFTRGVVWFGLRRPRADTHLTGETVTQLCVQSAISALRRWHRFHSHRSLDHRVSPADFSLACKGSRMMKTYNNESRSSLAADAGTVPRHAGSRHGTTVSERKRAQQ